MDLVQLAEPLLAESDAARLDHLALADVADAQEGPLEEGAPVAVWASSRSTTAGTELPTDPT